MLTFHYIPYARIAPLSSEDKIRLIITLVKERKILIIEGRLRPEEEATLISSTMDSLSEEFRDFKGIEIGILQNTILKPELKGFKKFKKNIASWLVKEEEQPTGVTIIGPAKIIKELRQEPEVLEMHFQKMFLKQHIKSTSKRSSGEKPAIKTKTTVKKRKKHAA